MKQHPRELAMLIPVPHSAVPFDDETRGVLVREYAACAAEQRVDVITEPQLEWVTDDLVITDDDGVPLNIRADDYGMARVTAWTVRPSMWTRLRRRFVRGA